MSKNDLLAKFSDFKEKKFIVIDDFPEFRTAIKRMVEAFGGEDIDVASSGDEAVDKLKSKKYDCILCDYNIGTGKDGQQVLEESKYRKLLEPTQIFVLITAESTAEMVMGALEYEPDGYLVKPFTKEMLHTRLIKIAAVKKEMFAIYTASAQNNIDEVVKLCDEKINNKSKVAGIALKFKGRQLIKHRRLEEAEKLYRTLLEQKSLPWIIMGMGQVLFYQGHYEEAKGLFTQLIEASDVCVEGYDWIGQCLWEMGDPLEAQNFLEKAIKMSSKAILRQQFISKVALHNGDYDTGERALRAAVQLGKHSCYRDPEDYFSLSDVLLKRAKDEGGNVRVANEAVNTLESLGNLYMNDFLITTRCHIYLGFALIAAGRKDKAKLIYRKTDQTLKKGKSIPDDLKKKFAEGLMVIGEKERAEELLQEISSGPENAK